MYRKEQENNMKQKGFTLIETLVAIFILTMTIGALLTLTTGGFYSVRYARNQIVANSLMQESLEYIRNDRDSAMLAGTTWDTWRGNMNSAGCFSNTCYVDPYTTGVNIQSCSSVDHCPSVTYYSDRYFYGYDGNSYPFAIGQKYTTSFVRSVAMSYANSGADQNQVVVTVKVKWLNGTNPKEVSQSTLLTNWTL